MKRIEKINRNKEILWKNDGVKHLMVYPEKIFDLEKMKEVVENGEKNTKEMRDAIISLIDDGIVVEIESSWNPHAIFEQEDGGEITLGCTELQLSEVLKLISVETTEVLDEISLEREKMKVWENLGTIERYDLIVRAREGANTKNQEFLDFLEAEV